MNEHVVRSTAERWRGYRHVLEARELTTSEDRLRVLASDEVRPVRVWVTRNPAAPTDALDALARDPDDAVRFNALLNPHTPDPALRAIAEREAEETAHLGFPWFITRQIVVHHPSASPKLRDELRALGACDCPKPCSTHIWKRPRLYRNQTRHGKAVFGG